MGWFLTKKKKSVKPVPKPSPKLSKPQAWDPVRTLRTIQICVGVTLVIGAGVGWYYAERALTAYANRLAQHAPIKPEQVQLANMPAWMSPKLQSEIQALAAGPITDDPLDRQALDSSLNAVRSCPWVSNVKRVQRTSAGTIRVVAEYRSPVAAVETQEGCRVVDADGILLPGLYEKEQGHHLGVPLITRVANPAPSEGTRWQGEDLKAGLALLQYLRGQNYFSEIRAFDVGDHDAKGRLRLSLLTRHGMVRWGLPIGEEQTIEPEPQVKRNSLALMQKQAGSIDANGKIVDVYGATINVSMPATNEPVAPVGYTLGR